MSEFSRIPASQKTTEVVNAQIDHIANQLIDIAIAQDSEYLFNPGHQKFMGEGFGQTDRLEDGSRARTTTINRLNNDPDQIVIKTKIYDPNTGKHSEVITRDAFVEGFRPNVVPDVMDGVSYDLLNNKDLIKVASKQLYRIRGKFSAERQASKDKKKTVTKIINSL